MNSYKDWYKNIEALPSLGKCKVYKQTKLEKVLANTLPYIIPFISKRRKIVIRSYWKHRYARRACTALCKLLMNKEHKPFSPIDFINELYEWEVITKSKDDEVKREQPIC